MVQQITGSVLRLIGVYMYVCKLWGGSCKRNNGETYLTKSCLAVWILHWVWPHYPTNSVIYSGKVLSLFTQEEQTDTCTLHDVIHFLKENKSIWSLIPEVMSLAKILLVMPATNATSECAFSALRRVKTYFRTTMSSNRLNHLMTCTVHKELVNILSLN